MSGPLSRIALVLTTTGLLCLPALADDSAQSTAQTPATPSAATPPEPTTTPATATAPEATAAQATPAPPAKPAAHFPVWQPERETDCDFSRFASVQTVTVLHGDGRQVHAAARQRRARC